MQVVFGEAAQFTYVAPLFAQTVVIGASYVLTRMVSTRAAGVLVVAILCEFDPYVRASSQIRPGMFSAMYVLLLAIALVLYCRAKPSKRIGPLLAIGVLSVLSYLTKISNLFFTPAVLLVMYLGQRRKGDVLGFLGLLALGFALESVVHFLMVGGTRVTSTFKRGPGPPLQAYLDLTYRLTRYLEDPYKLVIYPFFIAGPLLPAVIPSERKRAAALSISLLPISFLLIITFGVRSFDPLRSFMPFHSRYLNEVIPLCVVAVVVVLQVGVKAIVSQVTPRLGREGQRFASGTFSMAAALAALGMHFGYLRELSSRQDPGNHPFAQARRAYLLLSDTYERGLPILAPSDKRVSPRSKHWRSPPLHWAQKGFVRSELLLNQNGKLPRFTYQRMTRPISSRSRTMYLPASLPQKAVYRAYRRGDCVVTLIRRDRFVSIEGTHLALPETCSALRSKKPAKRRAR